MKSFVVCLLGGFLAACGGATNVAAPSAPAAAATAPAASYTVTGLVRDGATLAPLQGATVEWTGLAEAWGDRGHAVVTDANGGYRIGISNLGGPGAETGSIMMRASKTGYQAVVLEVSVLSNPQQNFNLPPATPADSNR